VFAACCHHRCTFSEYVANDYLQEIGISTNEGFSALRHISTWAVCGFIPTDCEEDVKLNAEKLELGRQAKRILEFGRARHLSNFGYKVELFQYVDFDVSPENILIVGHLPDAAEQN
jgi:tRNA:m4X modification enzyme